jgi:hypothetical protein
MNLQRDWTEPIIIHNGTQGWLKLSHAKSPIIIHNGTQGWLKLSHAKSPSWPNGTQANSKKKHNLAALFLLFHRSLKVIE